MEVMRRRSCTHRPGHKTDAQCPPGQARHHSSEARQLCSGRWPSRTWAPRQPRAHPSETQPANHGPPGPPEAPWAARCQQQQRRQSARRRLEWEAEPWPRSRSRRWGSLLLLPPPPPQPRPSGRRSSGCACAGGTRSPRASCRTCCTASGRCTGPSSGGTARTPWGSSPSRPRQPARPRALLEPRAPLRREPATP